MSLNRFAPFPTAIVLHHGCATLICDREGRIGGGEEGFYFRGTRFLAALDLTIDGRAPRPVSANAVAAHAMIAYFLAEHPASGEDAGEIAKKAIELQVDRFVDGGLHQRLRLTNHGLRPARVRLGLSFRADFADRSEVKSGKRQQEAPVEASWEIARESATLGLRYAHPRLKLGLSVRVAGAGERRRHGDGLEIVLDLAPQAEQSVLLDLCPRWGHVLVEPGCRAFGDPVADPGAAWTRLETPSPQLQRAWARAAADLAALPLGSGEDPSHRILAAGIPDYQALFGRDALIASAQARLLSPTLLRAALAVMARWQGRRDRPSRDEEPGKILHQRQPSPLALLGLNPFLAYYGDYTAPAVFLIGVALDFAATGDRAFVERMCPHIAAVLAWMERYGDGDGDGFYEYETRAEQGLKNQGWKDSGDAVLYPDGRIVPNPIAMAEIQAAYYTAKQLAGLVFLMIGEEVRGRALLDEAAALKRRFNERFWLAESQYFATALDPQKAPVASVGPDAGQCLAYGIVEREKRPAVAARLMRPDLFSGWGLRTLSAEHPAYNPFGYHLGDVWPWANALIAFGLRRCGFEAEFATLARAMIEASALFAVDRLPEAIGGKPRDAAHPHPGIYPQSNAPQAWSASAVISLVETMLGIVPLAPLNALLIDPALPEWIPALTLADIPIGGGRVTLRFRRDPAGWTEHEVVAAPPGLRIERLAAPPQRGEDRLEQRIRAVLEA